MYIIVMSLMTIFNILIFFVNHMLIKNFKINQIDFINQQNRNVVDIFNIKNRLGMFNNKV
jgi:hypothetical protein